MQSRKFIGVVPRKWRLINVISHHEKQFECVFKEWGFGVLFLSKDFVLSRADQRLTCIVAYWRFKGLRESVL